MSSHITILLSAVEHSAKLDPHEASLSEAVSSYTVENFNAKRDSFHTGRSMAVLTAVLASSRTLLSSSCTPLIVERFPVICTSHLLVTILARFSRSTFPFIRSLAVFGYPTCITADVMNLASFPLRNLRCLMFDLLGPRLDYSRSRVSSHPFSQAVLETLTTILMRVDVTQKYKTCVALILEKLELLGVADFALNYIFDLTANDETPREGTSDDDDDGDEIAELRKQSSRLPSLQELKLEVCRMNGARVTDGVLARCVEKIGSNLRKFHLDEAITSRHAATVYDVDRVIQALVETAGSNLRCVKISGDASKNHEISFETFQAMGAKCPNLSVLDLGADNIIHVDPVTKLCDRANIDGLCDLENDSDEEKQSQLVELRFVAAQTSFHRQGFPFSRKFLDCVISESLRKFVLHGGNFHCYFPSASPYSMLTIYQNAKSLQEIIVDNVTGVSVFDLHLQLLNIAENLQSLHCRPLTGNVDVDLTSLLASSSSSSSENSERPPPASHLKRLNVSCFQRDTSCSWLPSFAPNLECFSLHTYGFQKNLYKNICETLCRTLKWLHVDLEESPTPGIFEHIGKCTELEFLKIEAATNSQIDASDEREYSALKHLRNCRKLKNFELDCCELPEKLLYEMILP